MKNAYLRIRGIGDRVFAVIALVILSPLFLVLMLVVRLTMGPPVLFRQLRVGQNGRQFQILKFRTMVQGAEELGGGYMPKELNLVPPMGQFMRRSSLDELPQLLNIVRGDIAFVGPRPALPSQFERYTKEQAIRVVVPQGLTGLAQVRHRNNAPWSVRIEADLDYVARIGPRLDCWILIKTVTQVLKGADVRTDQSPIEVDDLGPYPTTRGSENED